MNYLIYIEKNFYQKFDFKFYSVADIIYISKYHNLNKYVYGCIH